MRKLALTLLVSSMITVPYAASSQEGATPSPEDFVCALAGECGEAEAPDADGSPRVSATRGFSLSRPNAPTPAPKAEPAARDRRQRASRPGQRQARRPAQQQQQQQQQAGRVDLRLAFGAGSAVLDPAGEARLRVFAEALKRPQLVNVRVRIEGHTDSSGGRALNLTLSQQRAQAVADFLVAQGIGIERLEVQGYGYDRPLPGRRASSGENRRVEAVRIS